MMAVPLDIPYVHRKEIEDLGKYFYLN